MYIYLYMIIINYVDGGSILGDGAVGLTEGRLWGRSKRATSGTVVREGASRGD